MMHAASMALRVVTETILYVDKTCLLHVMVMGKVAVQWTHLHGALGHK